MKTTARCLAELESEVKRLHSYDVRSLSPADYRGSKKYLSLDGDSVMKSLKKHESRR